MVSEDGDVVTIYVVFEVLDAREDGDRFLLDDGDLMTSTRCCSACG